MSQAEHTGTARSTDDTGRDGDLHRLDRKALTTAMSVLEQAPGVWLVQATREHIVATVDDQFACDCEGFQYGHECYHVRRLKFELGLREIPDEIDEAEIDEMFREWVDPVPIARES
jgi:hypothetical protein